jgi:alkylation response protein AidB-like acyl-CoA dehydrogenase
VRRRSAGTPTERGGQTLAKMQVNRFKFVEMLIQINAAQALAHQCIAKMARGEDITLDVSIAKVFCANMKQYVATTCVQLFGGSGYIWENPAARAFVDSRLGTIGGGADEVMKEIVAKMLKI